MNSEIWVDLKNFPGYEISSYGEVRNKKTNKILKSFPDRYGYLRLSIGNVDNVYIHRLMCETFYGPIDKDHEVNHIDYDRKNNYILNLEIVTQKENYDWSYRAGHICYEKGLAAASKVNKKKVLLIEKNIKFNSVKDCAKYFGVKPTNISRVLCGRRKTIRGYHLMYL